MIHKIVLLIFTLFATISYAQKPMDVQNKILQQYEHLIPQNASFASWTMYEVNLNDDNKKDYVFSYILCNKYKRHLHSGSGVLMLKTMDKNKFEIFGHIPSPDKDIYTFTGYSGNNYFINEYSAASNYSKIKRKLKFKKEGNKFIAEL